MKESLNLFCETLSEMNILFSDPIFNDWAEKWISGESRDEKNDWRLMEVVNDKANILVSQRGNIKNVYKLRIMQNAMLTAAWKDQVPEERFSELVFAQKDMVGYYKTHNGEPPENFMK